MEASLPSRGYFLAVPVLIFLTAMVMCGIVYVFVRIKKDSTRDKSADGAGFAILVTLAAVVILASLLSMWGVAFYVRGDALLTALSEFWLSVRNYILR